MDNKPNAFDRFAGSATSFASRGPFFASCVLLLVVWAPSILFLNVDTWQLVINTTTIITFLMVALLQNSQARNDAAIHSKLDAIADGLADFMEHTAGRDHDENLSNDISDLRSAIGVEKRVSA